MRRMEQQRCWGQPKTDQHLPLDSIPQRPWSPPRSVAIIPRRWPWASCNVRAFANRAVSFSWDDPRRLANPYDIMGVCGVITFRATPARQELTTSFPPPPSASAGNQSADRIPATVNRYRDFTGKSNAKKGIENAQRPRVSQAIISRPVGASPMSKAVKTTVRRVCSGPVPAKRIHPFCHRQRPHPRGIGKVRYGSRQDSS